LGTAEAAQSSSGAGPRWGNKGGAAVLAPTVTGEAGPFGLRDEGATIANQQEEQLTGTTVTEPC